MVSYNKPRAWNELPITLKTFETIATFRKVVFISNCISAINFRLSLILIKNFCMSVFTIMLNGSVLLRFEDIGTIKVNICSIGTDIHFSIEISQDCKISK